MRESSVAAMKVTPPAVVTGPPIDGRPVSCLSAGRFSEMPCGERQTILPVLTSTAISWPQGPSSHGSRVFGSQKRPLSGPRFAKKPLPSGTICWICPSSNALTTKSPSFGSNDPPAQFTPPSVPGK